MTTATPARATPDGTAAPQPPRPPRKRRSRRWLRLVGPPVAALVVLLLGTWLYQAEQPDLTDPAYLSPDSRADIGAAQLAGLVRGAGVTIVRRDKSSDALVDAYAGNVTLLITTPQLMHKYYLRMLKLLPASTRVVIVEPDRRAVADGLLPFVATARGYAARAADPGCGYAPAAQAGRAGVVRTRYGLLDPDLGREIERCYDDSLVVYRREATTVTVVGSADPFRNDRIGEDGNARLATGLLTGAPRLVWLDLHRREPPPMVIEDPDPGVAGAPAAPPSLRPHRSGDPGDTDFPVDGGDIDIPSGGGAGGDEQQQASRQDPPNPLWVAFPPWVYPAAALIVFAVALLMVALARRIGAPVVEPLPVVVRSSETALGRGRLYQRARARRETLGVLREAALARLVRLLRLDPGVDRPALVEAVAARTGWPPAAVDHTLFAPTPVDDAELVDAAARLEHLVDAVATEPTASARPGATAAFGNPAQPTAAAETSHQAETGIGNPAQPTAAAGIGGQAETAFGGQAEQAAPAPGAASGRPGAQDAPGGTFEGEPR